MNNCLKTQLKSIVDNNNLQKLGILIVTINATENSTYQKEFQIACNADIKLKAKNGTFRTSIGNFSEDRTEFTLTPSDGTINIRVNNANYSIEISNKYAITYLRRVTGGGNPIFSINLSELYCSDLTNLRFDNSSSIGDISNIKKAPILQELNFAGCGNIKGDISSLNYASSLSDIQLTATSISGNVDSLVLTGLISFNIERCNNVTGNLSSIAKHKSIQSVYVNSTGMSGSVEDFAEEWVKDNPNIGNIVMIYRVLRDYTFGGNKYPTENNNCFLDISSASKIAVHAGATTLANCPRVYTKGYTQSEAEASFPEKTIIRVDA